jgi:AbrB family looped-hinge helix DNA binding protein
MDIEYAIVNAKGQMVIPIAIRQKFLIDEGTRVAFLVEDSRLFIQPITDVFINEMGGILDERNLPSRVNRERERRLR